MEINWQLIAANGITLALVNFIFTLILKKKIDKKIEREKIAYSGIYKERLEICKSILDKVYTLKSAIKECVNESSVNDMHAELFWNAFEVLDKTISLSRPFMSENLFKSLGEIQAKTKNYYTESHKCLNGMDNMIRYSNGKGYIDLSNPNFDLLNEKWLSILKDFQNDNLFQNLDDKINEEVKKILEIS